MTTTGWTNWAGNQHARPQRMVRPHNVEDVAALVKRAHADGQRVKAVGSGHSFTPCALTDGVLLDMSHLSGVLHEDADTNLVTVAAGTPLHVLNRELDRRGLSMTNLGDIDRQTISGAISTGTHGTGAKLGGIATQVRALELVLADGSVVTCDADNDPELFSAARVGIGALGIITAVTLQCEDEFALHAEEQPLPLGEVLYSIQQLADDNDHFEFFWFPHTDVALTKRNNRLSPETQRQPLPRAREWFEDELLANDVLKLVFMTSRRWPSLTTRINRMSASLLSARSYSDTAHKVFTSPRRFRFLEAEFAIPREHVIEGFGRVKAIAESPGLDIAFPVEVRFAAADDIPLSTAHGRHSAYLAVHVFQGRPHQPYFDQVQDALSELGARPHWGKLHTLTAADLLPRYPRFDDFLAVRNRVDPDRALANDYLERVLGQ